MIRSAGTIEYDYLVIRTAAARSSSVPDFPFIQLPPSGPQKESTTAMEARNLRNKESFSESCPLAFVPDRLSLTLTDER
jgi:hypothetical protein